MATEAKPTITLMMCGHATKDRTDSGQPVCKLCLAETWGDDPMSAEDEARIRALSTTPATPDHLEGRMASCYICRRNELPSREAMAKDGFHRSLYKDYDTYDCGCSNRCSHCGGDCAGTCGGCSGYNDDF